MPSKPKIGEIYLVKFHPGIGSELKKYRPAVVISTLSYIDTRFVTVAPLTSSKKIILPDYEVKIKKGNGLEKDSILMTWYLKTIDISRVVYKIGQLTDSEMSEVKKILSKVVGS